MKLSLHIFLAISLLITGVCKAQEPNYPKGYWKARWIGHPTASGNDFGVFHFRKAIDLTTVPSSYIIHVSADNKYRLFVNGKSLGTGPARSNLANWNFETFDIAPYLKPGKNLVVATVWNFAQYRPYAQISYQTAFIVQGNSEKESALNTDKSWKVIQDSSYAPLPIDKGKLRAYVVVAEGEKRNANFAVWNAEDPSSNDANWVNSHEYNWYPAKTRGYGSDGNWMLVPRAIPLMEEKEERFAAVRRSSGIQASEGWLKGGIPFQIPANQKLTLLLDEGHLTNAYPHLKLNGGKNSTVTFTYAEALFDEKRVKGNRNDIEGKSIAGIQDQYIADGGKRDYSPLHFRTYRYLQLDIETKDQPLTLEDIYGVFTGYPFQEKAAFKSDQAWLDTVWQIGWRTARLCAGETYYDCPYYEQLQYVGDTRIQAMISLYVSGDERLMKKAINDISHSFFEDGLTESRYPSRDMQVIPTFSLWWVCMLHDFWMNRKDDAFVSAHLNGIASVLNWYQGKMAQNGMLGSVNWWQFVDWAWDRKDDIEFGGVPPGASKGGSSILSLQYAYTLQRAAALMNAFGRKELGAEYAARAKKIAEAVYRLCWDHEKKLLADTYEKKSFSQHANVMGILTDAVPMADQPRLLAAVMENKSITQCTYYFKFYMFEALKKVKRGDDFISMLQPWNQMIRIGLTTFAEEPEPTRSDCHAWSASPNYELLSLVCGVKSASPGFATVEIEPWLGPLKKIEGRVPHPKGEILVNLEQTGSKIEGDVSLPAGVTGNLRWKGNQVVLKGGKQKISLVAK